MLRNKTEIDGSTPNRYGQPHVARACQLAIRNRGLAKSTAEDALWPTLSNTVNYPTLAPKDQPLGHDAVVGFRLTSLFCGVAPVVGHSIGFVADRPGAVP